MQTVSFHRDQQCKARVQIVGILRENRPIRSRNGQVYLRLSVESAGRNIIPALMPFRAASLLIKSAPLGSLVQLRGELHGAGPNRAFIQATSCRVIAQKGELS